MHKLGVIVPYRNRYDHLLKFKESILSYLNLKSINFELIIVEQDNAKLFNRGMLLNIGFTQAKKLKCDYVVFHDVDMIPIDVDYSYSTVPLHLAINFIKQSEQKNRTIFDEYFGGVTMFSVEDFEKIDGYSNKYWGWGYEDNDLLFRCKKKLLQLNTVKYKNYNINGNSLKLNGINAYVKCKNVIDFKSSFSLFISFYPNDICLNHTKDSDEFTVLSIPGYDFAISYTSFLRYNFCCFDSSLRPYYVNSSIKPNYKTNIVITIDSLENIVNVYQDGQHLGKTETYNTLFEYQKNNYFYLGVGKPDRDVIPNFFKGYIDSFAYFDKVISQDEIYELSTTENKLFTENFGKYKSSNSLKTYYDSNFIHDYKLTDLSNNYNHGEIINCEIVEKDILEYTEVKIPYRKNGLFKSLNHEDNGFDGQKWKDQNTRWNQLRFINEVSNNISLIHNDGLSTLRYTLHGKTKEKNITHLNVGI